MKTKFNKNILLGSLIVSSTFLLLTPLFISGNDNKAIKVDAISEYTPVQLDGVPLTWHLKHNNEQEVRNYYAGLNNLPNNELKGYNLLKNLKPILKNNTTYVDYNTVWSTACITERDWKRSPIETIPCDYFDKSTMTITGYKDFYKYKNKGGDDPYLWVLYRNDNGTHNITINSAHNPLTGVGGLNKEHVWCQSRGFKGDPVTGPAGTDVHHLIIADALVNQASHNNLSYGDVENPTENNLNADWKVAGSYENTPETYVVGNYRGKTTGISSEVFEPLDEHKGDIARAIFYMAARYNNLAHETNAISHFEPYLTINNQEMPRQSVESSDETPVHMSYLKYLYQWHKDDPVDDFEIYRNDLIYNNVQGNRNPFIDFPGWVDLIWNPNGENTSSINHASPLTDEVKLYQNNPGQEGGETTPPTPGPDTGEGETKPDQGGGETTPEIPQDGELVLPENINTTFKNKTTIFGCEAKPTTIANLDAGKYFVTAKNNGNEIYLDSSTMDIENGKISANSPFNHLLSGGFVEIIKNSDGSYSFYIPSKNQYIGYEEKTNLSYENDEIKSNRSSWTVTANSDDENELFFTNAYDTSRALLYQVDGQRFGGYSTSNFNSKNYKGITLYKTNFAYDTLIANLKAMDCNKMQNKSFIKSLTALHDLLTKPEQDALALENIVCNDGNTYSASYAYGYALSYGNTINPINETFKYSKISAVIIIGIIAFGIIAIGVTASFIISKRKHI